MLPFISFLLHLMMRNIELWGSGREWTHKMEGSWVFERPLTGKLHAIQERPHLTPELNLDSVKPLKFWTLLQQQELPYLAGTGTSGLPIIAERIKWIIEEVSDKSTQMSKHSLQLNARSISLRVYFLVFDLHKNTSGTGEEGKPVIKCCQLKVLIMLLKASQNFPLSSFSNT